MKRPGRADIERMLERFLVDELLEESYDGSDPLAARAVDSLGLEQLVEYIEEELGVRFGDEELTEESFESIPLLAGLVDAKLRAGTL